MLFHVVPFNSLAATGLAAHPIFAGPQLEMSSFKDHWYFPPFLDASSTNAFFSAPFPP